MGYNPHIGLQPITRSYNTPNILTAKRELRCEMLQLEPVFGNAFEPMFDAGSLLVNMKLNMAVDRQELYLLKIWSMS